MSGVDPYRASRELERWLRNGVPEDQYRPRGLPADWMDRATVIGTITYNFDTDEVTFEYADKEQTGEAMNKGLVVDSDPGRIQRPYKEWFVVMDKTGVAIAEGKVTPKDGVDLIKQIYGCYRNQERDSNFITVALRDGGTTKHKSTYLTVMGRFA